MSSFAVDHLLDHKPRHAKACALAVIDFIDDAYVLSSEPGGTTPWHPSNATRAFGRLRHRMGLPTWVHPHGLRDLQSRSSSTPTYRSGFHLGPGRSPRPIDHHEHLRPLDPEVGRCGSRCDRGSSLEGPNVAGSRQDTGRFKGCFVGRSDAQGCRGVVSGEGPANALTV